VTRLILVRHGESNTTVARRIGGFRTCSGLSALGRLQAERLRDRLLSTGEISADVLISSQFPRAIETAEIIAPALGNLPIERMEGFGEHDPGDECDGLTFDEFVERYGPLDWETDPYSIGFPAGETLAAFHLRVGTAISHVVREHAGKTIVIACHGGVVDAVFRQTMRAPSIGNFDLWTVNTSVSEFLLVKPGRWRLIRYNDAAHLAGLDKETPRVPASVPAAAEDAAPDPDPVTAEAPAPR
jgi:probable phosphoglycerate mutase